MLIGFSVDNLALERWQREVDVFTATARYLGATVVFKNAENDNNTATFKVRGSDKHTNYVLPPENGKWYDKGDEPDTGVVLLQENLEDVLWVQNTRISGGEWINIEGSKKVYRHNIN